MTRLLDNIPEALTRPLDDASVQARIRTAIPVIAQRTLDLFALWSAALIACAGTVYVHESRSPGAADALRAWAGSRGFAIEDSHHVGQYGNYASLCVEVDGSSICVLRYRDLTDEEIARATSAEAAGKK